RAIYQDHTRGSSSWPGEHKSPTRGRIHLRRLIFALNQSLLAVTRRTIHSRHLSQIVILLLRNPPILTFVTWTNYEAVDTIHSTDRQPKWTRQIHCLSEVPSTFCCWCCSRCWS